MHTDNRCSSTRRARPVTMKLHLTTAPAPWREIALHTTPGVSPVVSREGNLGFIRFDHAGTAIARIAP
jgi:hypothetical protein